jgi:hypothetical protein
MATALNYFNGSEQKVLVMSTLVEIVLDAERESVKEFLGLVREEALRAAMRAASQASLARRTASRREPMRQEPTPGNRRPDPSLVNHGASDGRSEVRAVGRASIHEISDRAGAGSAPIRAAGAPSPPAPDLIGFEHPTEANKRILTMSTSTGDCRCSLIAPELGQLLAMAASRPCGRSGGPPRAARNQPRGRGNKGAGRRTGTSPGKSK